MALGVTTKGHSNNDQSITLVSPYKNTHNIGILFFACKQSGQPLTLNTAKTIDIPWKSYAKMFKSKSKTTQSWEGRKTEI